MYMRPLKYMDIDKIATSIQIWLQYNLQNKMRLNPGEFP